MKQVIVTRFSVPRPGSGDRHADPDWLGRRLDLFRRYFVPSVQPLGIPVVLLCSTASAPVVEPAVARLEGIRVVVQDDWRGGWSSGGGEVVTRLDSDDAVHPDWFRRIASESLDVDAFVCRSFLRLDVRRGRLHRYRRREPSPLVAFRPGLNPYAHDHADLERHLKVRELRGHYLLQIQHGGNLSNRPLRWWRFDRRASPDVLRGFGLDPQA